VKAPSIKPVRCAVYTRVSTEHGLDQEFNSLDAQYDAASAYIKSQAHAGWTLIKSRYDDGGYSGGSTDRPDLQRLLDDIRSRKIDVSTSRRCWLCSPNIPGAFTPPPSPT
jgi:site-specific DNA recombinase